MKSVAAILSSVLKPLRHPLLIGVFLFTGNLQQAVEKPSEISELDTEINVLHTPQVRFTQEYSEYIEKKVDSLLKRRKFNGSVLLAHQGQAVYNKSFGYARIKNKKEFEQSENIFQLASVGKQFTAIATLILYERGLIGLDDPVVNHIDSFPYPDITIRHLLNHTSGLQSYFSIIEKSWKEDHLPVHQDLLDLFSSHKVPLNFTPGSRFSYSNTGYAFLALLIERVSGETFSSFLKNNLFNPLGMKNSFAFHPSMSDMMSTLNLSMGYERRGRAFREIPIEPLDGITGDKGIFSCTEDLLKWDTALENNRLVSEQTKELAFSAGKLRNGRKISYGFGYRIRPVSDNNIIYHNGWWRGFKTSYVRLPEKTLIVILNNTNASINGLEEGIRNIINKSAYPVYQEDDLIATGESAIEN